MRCVHREAPRVLLLMKFVFFLAFCVSFRIADCTDQSIQPEDSTLPVRWFRVAEALLLEHVKWRVGGKGGVVLARPLISSMNFL